LFDGRLIGPDYTSGRIRGSAVVSSISGKADVEGCGLTSSNFDVRLERGITLFLDFDPVTSLG